MATTSPGGVSIWDVKSGKERRFAEGPKGYAYALDWSPDGQTIAFGTRSSNPWVWELESGNAPREIPAPGRLNGLSFHPTKSWLALACVDNTTRVVALNGEVIGAYAGHQAEVNAIDFSRDGRWVTSVGDDGRIRTWKSKPVNPSGERGESAVTRSFPVSEDGKA